MRRAMLAGAAVMALCGSGWGAQWIPPRPGQTTCSGWDTPAARDACQAKEDRQQAATDAARQAEGARVKTIQDAEDARIRAEREVAEAARQRAAATASAQRAADEARSAAIAGEFSARARAWDFDADQFGTFIGLISRSRGDYIHADRPSCSQPEADEAGVCTYTFAYGTEMDVTSRPGTFRAARVTVRWDGDRRGAGSFYRLMMVVGYALAPEDDAGTAINRASGALGVVGSDQPWPERRWTLGRTDYLLRPDAKLGARSAVIFVASDAAP